MKSSSRLLLGFGVALTVSSGLGAPAYAESIADFAGTISLVNPVPANYREIAGFPIAVRLYTTQVIRDSGNPAGSEFHVHGLPPFLTFVFQEYSPSGLALGGSISATGALSVTNAVYATDNVGSTASGVYIVTPPVFAQYWSGATVKAWATLYRPLDSSAGVQASDTVPYMWQPDWTGNPSGTSWVNVNGVPSMAYYTSFSQNMYDTDDPIEGRLVLDLMGHFPETPYASLFPLFLASVGLLVLAKRRGRGQ